MKHRIGVLLAAVAFLVAGCATTPQQPVLLSAQAVGSQAGRVGVAMTALPKPDVQLPGAGCLLCLAAASLANSSLSTHAQTLTYEDLPKLKQEVAELLRKRGTAVTVIEEDLDVKALPDFGTKGPNIAAKDFSSLQQKYRVDKLLVINIAALGFIRTYSSYVPTSDPKGLIDGVGYMVDLKKNTYEWFRPVHITKSATQNWDEPPKFPGLTNAYYQVLELGKDSLIEPFAGEAVAAAPAAAGDPAPVQGVRQ